MDNQQSKLDKSEELARTEMRDRISQIIDAPYTDTAEMFDDTFIRSKNGNRNGNGNGGTNGANKADGNFVAPGDGRKVEYKNGPREYRTIADQRASYTLAIYSTLIEAKKLGLDYHDPIVINQITDLVKDEDGKELLWRRRKIRRRAEYLGFRGRVDLVVAEVNDFVRPFKLFDEADGKPIQIHRNLMHRASDTAVRLAYGYIKRKAEEEKMKMAGAQVQQPQHSEQPAMRRRGRRHLIGTLT